MSKDIVIRMNSASINDAIKELEKLHEDFLRKLDLFVRVLTNDGVAIALLAIRQSVGSNGDAQIAVGLNNLGDIVEAEIQMIGDEAVFIEFGAGIYYNPTDPPHAKKVSPQMGVGTYPGQRHAYESGWFYYDAQGKKQYTHGTYATSPLYRASENYRNNAIKTALQIFRS